MNTTLRYSALVTLLLGSTSIALADGGPGGPSNIQGIFTIGGGLATFESTDDDCGSSSCVDASDLMLNGAASVNVWLGREWSIQLDVAGEQIAARHNDDADGNQYLSAQAIGGHVTWHKPGTGLIGVFAAFGAGHEADTGSGCCDDGDESQSGGLIGLEGQLYFNEFTLYAQAATLDISDHDDDNGLNSSAYLVRLVGRYFVNDNLKIEGELARVDGDAFDGDSDESSEGTEWALSVQGRLDGQVYGSVGYRGGEYKEHTFSEADIDMFTVNVTFLFNVDSLKANDRTANTLETPMMAFRGAGILEAID